MSGTPAHGLGGWGFCGHPEDQGELWGASRDVEEEEHRLDHRGRTLHGYHEMLAGKMGVNNGDIWLAEAREAGACPGDFSHPVLPSRDVGMAVGIRCSPSPAQGIWVDGLPARLPAKHSSPFQWEVATQQYKSCEIQPCVGTGCT